MCRSFEACKEITGPVNRVVSLKHSQSTRYFIRDLFHSIALSNSVSSKNETVFIDTGFPTLSCN